MHQNLVSKWAVKSHGEGAIDAPQHSNLAPFGATGQAPILGQPSRRAPPSVVLVARRDPPIAAMECCMSAQPTPVDGETAIYEDFTSDLLASFPLTELSVALRAEVDRTVHEWTGEVRENIPAASRLPFDQLADTVPAILRALADAVGSDDPTVRHQLLVRSPSQGITRFQQHYDTRDLMAEDRLLRRQVSRHARRGLRRPMTETETDALHMGLDLMSQQATTAFVEHQAAQLRAAAEAELRYLSFLSHDLSNNLSGVTVWLQVLRSQLQVISDADEHLGTLDSIQQAILTTVGGMGRLLQAERLRHGGKTSEPRRVNLRSLVTNHTRQIVEHANLRGLRLVVDVPEKMSVVSDPELLALVLQNLIGNAAKFASPGTVTVRAQQDVADGGHRNLVLTVVDQGPGIPTDQCERIFQAFQRGTMQGQSGVGLGLAIASRAASLLGGRLTVESKIGVGSTFTLTLPGGPTGER